jgi:hypothetical protein
LVSGFCVLSYIALGFRSTLFISLVVHSVGSCSLCHDHANDHFAISHE